MSSAADDVRLARLTPKEVACLRLVGQRMSSKEIATELGIAKTSVDTYCNRARAKLEVGGRQEAARLLRAAIADGGAGAAADDALETRGGARVALAPLTSATLGLLATAMIATLAFGALMAGFHALDAMKPAGIAATHLTTTTRPADRS